METYPPLGVYVVPFTPNPLSSTTAPSGISCVWELTMDNHAEEHIVPYAPFPWEQAEQSRAEKKKTC